LCYADLMTTKDQVSEGQNRFVLDLLHRVGQFAEAQFAHCVGNSGITSRQYIVLAAIAQSEGLNQIAIVNATGVDRSTVTEMVGRLVKMGWLRRRRSRKDSRGYAVTLTRKGRNALKDGEAAARETDEKVLAVFPAARRDQLLEALGKIVEVAAYGHRSSVWRASELRLRLRRRKL